jgi:pimeloyl-ACP methyl ester carboxylesterase
MPQIKCNKASLFYKEAGAGPETIIFSHGLLFDNSMWAAQVEYFKDHYRCIAYDHRGQGQSELVGSEDMDTLYEDAASLIEQLAGNNPVHFVGLSMGGFIGMRLAARKPHLIKTLTLLDTSADAEPNLFKYKLLNTIFKLGGAPLVINKIIKILFGKSSLNDSSKKEIIQCWKSTIQNYPPSITKAVEGVITRQAITSELSKIICPTLVAVGEEDVATIPAKSERIQQGIKNSRLIIIPKAGHSACLEQPKEVNKIIHDFIR